MIREDYSHFQAALVPRYAVSRVSMWKTDCPHMGYADPYFAIDEIHKRNELHNLGGLKYIVGWAEQAHGGWIGYARDDQGAVHRVGCVRACQADAIRAARSLVSILREYQVQMRHLYANTYKPNLSQRIGRAA